MAIDCNQWLLLGAIGCLDLSFLVHKMWMELLIAIGEIQLCTKRFVKFKSLTSGGSSSGGSTSGGSSSGGSTSGGSSSSDGDDNVIEV